MELPLKIYHCATIFILIILKIECIASQLSNLVSDHLPEDAILNFTGLATKYGRPPLEYTVITEDGYILTLYRLPGRSRYPVLLMHGLYDSSDTFLLRGKMSLGITLANDGYDVWIGNSRGNRYSRKHTFLNPDTDSEYWKFSFHQIGYYDLPAIIDTILKETKASSLTAIAHSQGTTTFFVLGSTRKEYNSKINVMIAMAPICYVHNTRPPPSTLIALSPFLEEVVNLLNINEFFGDNSTAREILQAICTNPLIGYTVCFMGIYFEFCGYDPSELEPSFNPIFMTHYPAGGSAMSGLHFLQVGRRKIFARYDFGTEQNKLIYNSSIPTAYDLSNVEMPVALFTARNDRLSTLPDVAILRQELPNVVYNLINPRSLVNHLDYTNGKRIKYYLLPYIYRILKQYNGFDMDNYSS